MKTKNFVREIDSEFIRNGFANTIVSYNHDIIIFDNCKIIYSNNVNEYLKNTERYNFPFSDFEKITKKNGLFQTTYINQIFELNKPYVMFLDNKLYEIYFYGTNERAFMTNFELMEIKLSKEVNRTELNIFLQNKFAIKDGIVETISIPLEEDIKKSKKEKTRKILSFSMALLNSQYSDCVDYDAISKTIDNDKKKHSFRVVDNIICFDKDNNYYYRISIDYLNDDKYKINYSVIPILEYDFETAINFGLTCDSIDYQEIKENIKFNKHM